VSAGTHQVDGAVTGSKSTAITPLLATGQLPADHLPSVTVRPLPGGIGAGSPVAVEVVADEGEHWFRDQPGEPDSEPIVTYAGTTRTLEDSTVVGSAFHRRRRRRRDLPPPWQASLDGVLHHRHRGARSTHDPSPCRSGGRSAGAHGEGVMSSVPLRPSARSASWDLAGLCLRIGTRLEGDE
jgi:hypothetical protein